MDKLNGRPNLLFLVWIRSSIKRKYNLLITRLREPIYRIKIIRALTSVITNKKGDQKWYLNGKRHREDGPAFIRTNGDEYWFLNGKRHRENGPAFIRANGDKHWWLNGNRHRENGPAVIYVNGRREWWLNNKRHREDGPAIIYETGRHEWYLNGAFIRHSFFI